MAVDLSNYKIPIYQNINDTPVEPTASKAGNGADLINRINGLIDELAVLLNNVPSTAIKWTAKIPAATDYASIEVYYTNISDRQMNTHTGSDNPLGLFSFQDLVKSYRLGTDISSGEIIDISEIISKCGVGHYFFLFKNNDNTLKTNSLATIENPIVKGVVSPSPEIKLTVYNEQYVGTNTVFTRPLAINQIISEAQITLFDNFVIG